MRAHFSPACLAVRAHRAQATWADARTALEFALAWLGASQFFRVRTGDLCQENFPKL